MGRLRPRKSARAPRRARARRACTVRGVLSRGSDGARVDVCDPPSLAFGLRACEQDPPLLLADMHTRREVTMVGNWQRWGSTGAGAGQKKDAEEMVAFHEMELVAGVAQANALAGWLI